MENKVAEIFNAIIRENPKQLSLCSGLSGNVLMAIEYYKNKGEALGVEVERMVQYIIDESINNPLMTFSSGQAGMNWLYSYLYKEELIEAEDYIDICFDAAILQQYSLQQLSPGNWDFLHGAVGIAYSSLYSYKEEYRAYFVQLFKGLDRICNENMVMQMFPNFYFEKQAYIMEEVNLGLAHGIPSILKFCIQCYKQNVCKNESFAMGKKIVAFLQQHTNINKTGSYFPSFATSHRKADVQSRLAWCYGDLGIGIILYQAGIAFNDHKIVGFALEVLMHTTKRRSVEETNIHDASICHGSAGVAHIYNRMWHYTNDPLFKEATDYWMQKTWDFAYHEDGVAGYKMYHPKDNSYHNSFGLLEGAAGIGLVLLSYLTGNFSWDYCLMLND